MDQHDLKESGIESNVGHPCSPKKPSLVGKGNSLCDEELDDASAGLRKQGYGDHEINRSKAEKLQGIERNDHNSSSDCTKESIDDLRPSFIISTQRNSVVEKQIFVDGSRMMMPCCNGVKGTETLKSSEASPKVNSHLKKISMNSDISSDNGQHLDNDLHAGMNRYWFNTVENGLKSGMQATFPEKQCKTESSSSNSSHVILPASSNDSCQETSLDIQSCKLIKINAMDTSTCTDLKSNLKEPAIGSLPPGLALRNLEDKLENAGGNLVKVAETLDSVRTVSSYNVGRMSSGNNYVTMENLNSLNSDSFKKETEKAVTHGKAELHKLEDSVGMAPRVAREVDQEFEASGSSSSVEGRNSEMIRRSFVDSVDSSRKSCLTETGSVIQQCKGQDKSFSFCSMKEVLDTRKLSRNESLCSEVKEPLPDKSRKVTPEVNDGLLGQELSYRTMKAVGLRSRDHIGHLPSIDLNEDVQEQGVEYAQQLGKETVPNIFGSVSKPKAMVAKSGIPLSIPTPPKVRRELEFDGWRGSAANSAFRPTSITKKCSENNNASSTNDENDSGKHSAKRIDLNVAFTGLDFDVEFFKKEPVLAESCFPSKKEVGSTQARKLDFDLNCVSGNDDCHQSSVTTSLSKQSVRDFDLNDNPTSVDSPAFLINPTSSSRHFGQGTEALRSSRGSDSPPVSSVENPKQQDFRNFSYANSADLSSMPGFVPGHVQPFLVAAPHMLPSNEQLQRIAFLQPQLAYAQPPPHAFRVDTKDSLSSTTGPHTVLPYMVDPHSSTILSQVLGSGGLSAIPSTPHVFQVPHGLGPSNIAMTRPNVDIYNGLNNSLENVNRGANAGQLCIPSSNSTPEEQMKSLQQVGLSAAGMKRREPEGGWDTSQLSFRQMTYWR